jgi:hypothetical protein
MASIEHPSVYKAEEEALSEFFPLWEDTPIMIKMVMQAALAKMHGESLEDFVEHHGKDFGDKYFDKDPDAVVAAFHANPAGVLHEAAEFIYH